MQPCFSHASICVLLHLRRKIGCGSARLVAGMTSKISVQGAASMGCEDEGWMVTFVGEASGRP